MAFMITVVGLCAFVVSFGLVDLKPVHWNDVANPILLVRMKRSPNRAFSYSAFNPNAGLATFATSADFMPSFYRYSAPPPPPNYAVDGRGESYLPSSDNDPTYSYPPQDTPVGTTVDDRTLPSQNLTPPADIAPGSGYSQNAIQAPKKPKKKPAPQQIDEEEDDFEAGGRPRSSSSASFNAWFPIVLGAYPSKYGGGNSEAYKDDSAPVKETGGLGTTVIANSVSHGRSGVASSHAISYGGERPMQSYRRG